MSLVRSRKWQPTPVFLPGKFHGQGAWQATALGVTKSGTRLSTHALRTRFSSSRHPLCFPWGEKLQLRGDGGDTEGCAPECQAELPPPTKLHYLSLACWLLHWPQGPVGTQGHGSQLLVAKLPTLVRPENWPDGSQVPSPQAGPFFQLLPHSLSSACHQLMPIPGEGGVNWPGAPSSLFAYA